MAGYMVEKREKGSDDWVNAITVPVKEPTANVQNLTEGKFYEFRVVALNTAGQSRCRLTGPVDPGQLGLAR